MQALFWLLLPLAALSGWWIAIYGQKRRQGERARLNSVYGQGINHLLNEEPDKAVEVLVQLVEVDPDTIELHLALGSLFRRRGEVDRAIRVHQNIIARSKLSEVLRNQATLELARDFLKAGLLDRAEQLLSSLLARNCFENEVCTYLADLYQQEKEWRKAIDAARPLVAQDPAHWRARIAHYYCELGEEALRSGDYGDALALAQQALAEDADCARASFLLGSIYQHQGEFAQAIKAYQAVEQQNSSLIPEVLADLENCYAHLPGDSRLPEKIERAGDSQPQTQQAASDRYRCVDCGFSSRKLFWQCPGCRGWSSIKPISLSKVE